MRTFGHLPEKSASLTTVAAGLGSARSVQAIVLKTRFGWPVIQLGLFGECSVQSTKGEDGCTDPVVYLVQP